MRRSVEQVVNQAASEMRAPTRFTSLIDELEDDLRAIDDETLRDFGVSPDRRVDQDWGAVLEKMAQKGNFFLVFDGEGSDIEFVMGDEQKSLHACFLVTDPVPFERPLTSDDRFVVALEGYGWSVREYEDAVLETIFKLGSEPEEE